MPRTLRAVIIPLTLITATALLVVLSLQNRSLINRTRELAAKARDPHPGVYVPAVNLETVEGDSVRLGESGDGRQQLLFVFSTRCDHCLASLLAWNRIASKFDDDPHVQVVGLSTDSVGPTLEFFAAHNIRFPVVSFVDHKLRSLYRARIVPQTILLDPKGLVTYVRLGAIGEDVVADSVIAQAHVGTNPTRTNSITPASTPAEGVF